MRNLTNIIWQEITPQGHGIVTCDDCGTYVMEGRSGTWECECGWSIDCN